MTDQPPLHDVQIRVNPSSMPLFTTILQSGIEVSSTTGTSLGEFLSQFPGFTGTYLADTVQTIFLNGTAVDDLTLLLQDNNPVLALSGAMPGLAGAIFRKNSFHAALRTDTSSSDNQEAAAIPTSVTLKLFNRIAKDRGEELLALGVTVKSKHLAAFFNKRPTLWQNVEMLESGPTVLNKEMFEQLISQSESVSLKIIKNDE